MVACECAAAHERRRVVLTGGPGAGKTAVLELIRQSFCKHVKVLPEAATIVFGGGFPREDDANCKRAAQRAIFYVQRELESAGDSHNPTIVLCDRGTLDGLAYWPGSAEEFCASLATTVGEQIARYDAVIHLRTPPLEQGYNHQNPLRTESAAAAAKVDEGILQAWATHPRRFVVEASSEFLDKAAQALTILRAEMPECCRHHVIPELRGRQSPNWRRAARWKIDPGVDLPTHVSAKEAVRSAGAIEEGVIEVTGVRCAFETSEGGIDMEKDVVCGMQVDPAKAVGSSQYNGKTYYFCSKGCKTKFDANPGQFVK